MNKDIDTLLHSFGLTRVANQLEQIALPSIRIASTAIRESLLSPGASKLGGLPDLPPEIEWPTWNDVPLAFIAQIDLAEVHTVDRMGVLPPSGLLSFFYNADHIPVGYDPAWRGGWRVLYYDGIYSRLRRVPVPVSLLERQSIWMPVGQHYTACALTFSLETTLPPVNSSYIQTLDLSEQEHDAYLQILKAMREREDKPLHRLLGHPDTLQGDMQLECQLVSHGLSLAHGWPTDMTRVEELQAGSQEWQLLLQLDTDPEAQMVWGIEGRCYYWIQAKALQDRQFEHTWFIMQWT